MRDTGICQRRSSSTSTPTSPRCSTRFHTLRHRPSRVYGLRIAFGDRAGSRFTAVKSSRRPQRNDQLKPITWIYNFQTLIAGALALGGAVVTIWGIRHQVKQSENQENERRRRQNMAARAMMPVALMEIHRYARECVSVLLPVLPDPPEQRITAHIGEIPPIPADALFTLRQSVEFGSNEIATYLSDLIRYIQIQHARITDAKRDLLREGGTIVLRANILQYTIDSLDILARADKLYPYARRDVDVVPEKLQDHDLRTAARACGIWDDDDSELFIRIKRDYGPPASPQ